MLYLTCSLCRSISCCPTMWVQHCRCQRAPAPCPSPSRWIRIRMSRRRHKMENQCLFALTADPRSGFRHHVMRCASGRPRAGAGRGLGLQIDLARAQDTDRQTRTDGLMMDRWSQRSAAASRLSEVAKRRGRGREGGGPPAHRVQIRP